MDIYIGTIKKVLDSRIFLFSLGCSLLVATCFSHFWNLNDVPSGIYVDESSLAYNSFCIARTGADEHGIRYPVFFLCFGNYQDPVMAYVDAALVTIFDFEKWVIRLPSGLFHVLAAIVFFFLASKFTRYKMICMTGAFVVSVLPWLFPLSRTGIGGYMPMVFGIIVGCYSLFEAFGKRSIMWAIMAGISWAFTMYAHQIGRPMTAVILLCFVLSFNVLIVKRWKTASIFLFILIAALIPMAVYVYHTPASMTSRFNAIAVWREAQPVSEVCFGILQRYLEYFSLDFLFISGDRDLRHNIGTGELFLFLLPLILAGFYVMIRYFKQNPYYRFILLCVLTYPAAAVLTISHYHSTRCMNGAPFWCITSAIGLNFLYLKRKKMGIVLIVIMFMAAYEIPDYMFKYFGKYQKECRASFSADAVEAVRKSLSHLGKDETLYISKYIFFPEEMKPEFKPEFYTNILFLMKLDPVVYRKRGIPEEKVCLYQEKIVRPGILLTLDNLYFLDENNNIRGSKDFEKRPSDCKLIERIPTPSGIYFEIYRVN